MKSYIVLVVLSAAILAAVHGKIPEGKNVKTSVKQLSWLEKMLIRKFHPKMDLNQMLGLENRSSKKDGDNAIQDDYDGGFELVHIDLPLLFLQLVKLGDDIQLPNFTYDFVWWFCIWDMCDGFADHYVVTNLRLKTVTTTNLHASMNGTKFRVDFKIPDLEFQCPECILDHTNYGSDPPATSDNTFWTGYSMYVKNYSLSMTGDFQWNFDRIDVTNLDITWEMDEVWDRQWNATHTNNDGTQEEWGSQDDLIHERLLEDWVKMEEYVEETFTYWLNCYLSNGRNNKGECGDYFNEPLHNISAAEILHGFGLAALNNQRAAEHDLSREINLNADDPIDTMNSIIFEFGTHVMQTARYVAAVYEDMPIPFGIERTFKWVVNKEICSENSTGNTVCEPYREQTVIGAPADDGNIDFSTAITGMFDNRASLTFDASTVGYSFHVADLTLMSRDYQRLLTNLNTGDQQVFSGLNLNVFNCSIGFVADYAFEDGHFGISNSKIELFMDKVTVDISKVNYVENGEWTDMPSIHKDAAPMVMELWQEKDQDGVSLQERYRVFVEDKINDFLAGRITI